MKLLLATVPYDEKGRYGSLAGAGSSIPNLGLLMLAGAARQAGHDCLVIDAGASVLSRDEFIRRVLEYAPDVVGFTVTTLEVAAASLLATEIRQLLPKIRILVGGPHISAAPEETMRRYPSFDIAAVGEGEETLCELLSAFSSGSGVAAIPGIVYRDGREIHTTPRRPFIADMDKLPYPAWDLLEGFPRNYSPPAFKTRRLPAASLVTSRGCPNKCIFCDRSVFGSSCHGYSADYVIGMVKELYEKYGVREVCFEDDTFVTFKKRLMEICKRLIEMKLDLSWSCLGRVNQVDAGNLELMKRAGCWQISYGIESGSQKILNLIRKNVTLDQIRNALDLSSRAGILNKGFFIVGHPGETRETLRETIDFALELPLHDVSATMLTPFPGTELYERAAEFGVFDADWSRMNLLNAVFVPHGLTEGDLLSAQKELLKRFYLRPRIIGSYASRLLSNPSLCVSLAKGFRAFVRSV